MQKEKTNIYFTEPSLKDGYMTDTECAFAVLEAYVDAANRYEEKIMEAIIHLTEIKKHDLVDDQQKSLDFVINFLTKTIEE